MSNPSAFPPLYIDNLNLAGSDPLLSGANYQQDGLSATGIPTGSTIDLNSLFPPLTISPSAPAGQVPASTQSPSLLPSSSNSTWLLIGAIAIGALILFWPSSGNKGKSNVQ